MSTGMSSLNNSLKVAIAAPMSSESVDIVRAADSRITVVYQPDLLPPMRFPADFSGDPSFRRSDEQQQRYEQMVNSAEALFGAPDADAPALGRAVVSNQRLRWVHTMAAGGGSLVKEAGLSDENLQRVLFTTSAGIHGTSLAEFALFGLLSGAKHLPRLQQLQAQHEWPARWPMGQLSDQRILILGLGGIGSALARKLSGLGVRVVGMSRRGRQVDGVDEIISQDQLMQVASEVDGIVNTLPGTEATKDLLSDGALSRVKPGATIVNVGRGTVIDEQALYAALESGRVGFAALDVFATEPLPDTSPLWDHPHVLVSPHTAALTLSEEKRIAELFAENAVRLLDGQHMRNRVDTGEFY